MRRLPEGAPVPGYGHTAAGTGGLHRPPRKRYFRRSELRSCAAVVYTIAVMDRRGDDGRLVINARNGRIIRFMPAYRRDGIPMTT